MKQIFDWMREQMLNQSEFYNTDLVIQKHKVDSILDTAEQKWEAERRCGVPKVVSKKILPRYFDAVWDGTKNFELRKDEDDIQEGDTLILKEWDGQEYTGSSVVRTVKYVLRNVPEYGLQEGYCIIGW